MSDEDEGQSTQQKVTHVEDCSSKLNQQIKELKVLRGIVKGQVTKLKTYITSKSKEANIFELETKLGLLENYFSNFNNHQSRLECIDEDEPQTDERANFEDIYFKLKSKILKLINSKNPRQSISLDKSLSGFSNHVNVPSIKNLDLPQFNGEMTEFLEFWSSFSKLVDENTSINEITKFQYLKGCLVGKAKNIIKNIDNIEEGYKEAIELLKIRYLNKKLLFNAHINSILDIQEISKPTSDNIRSIADTINGNLRSLLTIGEKSQIADALLLKLVVPRLDRNTQIRWEEFVAEKYINAIEDDEDDGKKFLYPTFEEFSKFIERRCVTLDSLENNRSHTSDKARFSSKKSSFVVTSPEKCLFCQESPHDLQNCKKFSQLSPMSRYNEAKKLKLCILCLKTGHGVKQCRAKKCMHCNENHHNLLHRKNERNTRDVTSSNFNNFGSPTTTIPHLNSSNNSQEATTSQNIVENPHSTNSLVSNSDNRQVILPSALINVVDSEGNTIQCRALLDSASQSNFVTNKLAQKLKLNTTSTNTIVSGIGNLTSSKLNFKTDILIRSRINRFTATLEAILIDKITGLQPNRKFDIQNIKVPNNLSLADPYFNVPNEIDLLIGAELFWKIICVGQIRNNDDSPIFQKTMLGWVVSGTIINSPTFSFCCTTTEPVSNSLEQVMEKFWSIENLDDEISKPSLEHLACEEHFKKNFARDSSGRCVVKLPLHLDPVLIGDSYNIALKRFLNLEKKLHSDLNLKLEYTKFLKEYLDLQHMEPVELSSIDKNRCFFLPHHCVVKLESSSTKYRVVFDGSCKGTGKRSLNDALLNGPIIQQDLFTILLRFRSHKFVLGADIVKMYRQILVDESDRNLQCILWRNKPEDPIQIFRLTTVTYGTKSASYLAIRSLNEIAMIYSEKFRVGSKIILTDFYVDNLLTGNDSLEALQQIKEEIVKILNFGNFPLKKWASNSAKMLQNIPKEDQEPILKFQDDDVIKTLGLNWSPSTDCFVFYFNDPGELQVVCKRSILSLIARFFDPLGLINPIITAAKIFQQHLWKIKLDWDESLPMDLFTKWKEFSKQLTLVNEIRFKRYVFSDGLVKELHCFADASEKAYGACIYLRSIQSNGTVDVQLMCAKSKVAPLKTITLARLELCASLLLCRLLQKVKSPFEINFSNIYCWTDSTIALSWINSNSYEFSTFVANRITRIQELSKDCVWKHCPTDCNPADFVSRGSTPQKLVDSKIWFYGPEFLYLPPSSWPKTPDLKGEIVPEKKQLKFSFVASNIEDEIGSHKYVNNFFRMTCIFGYVSRFIKNAKNKQKISRSVGNLTVVEIQQGLILVIKNLQAVYFSSDLRQLKTGQLLNSNSRIRCLNPFLDTNNIIRVGGRIKYSNLPFSAKHQILLPNSHPFINSLINYYHLIFCHTGCQNLLNILREKFWIINGKQVIRKVISQCVTCFKANPRPTHQLMGDLPHDRVIMQRPFLVSGVDYCGPFLITNRIRGRPPYKCYISIFVCFSTKAVHMELVTDLTSNSFLAALKRFFARRGKAAKIYSDNATNFVGVQRHLKELFKFISSNNYKRSIEDFSLKQSLDWKFIPPRAPHWGGLWESAVKIAKYHLYRTCRNNLFSYEEFYTLICQVEMTMNSRPITPLSSDPNDFSALSPGHFLIGQPMVCINYPPINDSSTLSYRYKNIQNIYQKFWSQWSKGYLNNLQGRQKWSQPQLNLQVDDLVLLIEKDIPTMKWPLGRITYLHPSLDKKVRVVTVKTESGTYIRNVNKLCRLPVESRHFQGGQNEEISSPET